MYPSSAKRNIRRHVMLKVDKLIPKREIRTLPPNAADFTPAFDIASLPTELWHLVLREATPLLPDPLYKPIQHTFLVDSGASSAPCKWDDYAASMREKLNLASVSTVWHELMQPLLFEFIWIRSAKQGKALAKLLLEQSCGMTKGSAGRFIRRLHIETRALSRCAVEDIKSILDCAPNLINFTDQRSVCRDPLQYECPAARYTPRQVFGALAHVGSLLQRLVWTNYDQDDIFPLYALPNLHYLGNSLEYLELSSANFDVSPNQAITSLKTLPISLPRLQSLKVILDNVTFAMMAPWDMPKLRNLYVMSSDFMYAGDGFAKFFDAHGAQIFELELGHPSAVVEEHLVYPGVREPIPLAKWLPNLEHFICSANAEWNWRTPDYISPHVLLPTHPNVQLIGIRHLDIRLIEDRGRSEYFRLREQISSLFRPTAFPSLQFIRDLSPKSMKMRSGGGLSGKAPDKQVLAFWGTVLGMGRERAVWFEAWDGSNITRGQVSRALKGPLTWED
ncbi:hypothetical protein HWV62_12182 [Athelia sp. TMB]|nr:hypothetical protein HWV62_12182 [Athelia sp. TMB]